MADTVLMLDVDGVLVTGRLDGGAWSDRLEAELGISKVALQDVFFRKHWAKIIVGQTDMMPLLQAALDEIGSRVDAAELRDYWFRHDATINRVMLREIEEIRASGVPVWLATNQEHHRASFLLNDLGLAAHVDGAVWSAKVGAKKPDAAFFAAATAKVGHPTESYVFVDDQLQNVEAARAFGWQAHQLKSGQSLRALFAAI